jgi:hypothetical protein
MTLSNLPTINTWPVVICNLAGISLEETLYEIQNGVPDFGNPHGTCQSRYLRTKTVGHVFPGEVSLTYISWSWVAPFTNRLTRS